jgi:hypothetical protein
MKRLLWEKVKSCAKRKSKHGIAILNNKMKSGLKLRMTFCNGNIGLPSTIGKHSRLNLTFHEFKDLIRLLFRPAFKIFALIKISSLEFSFSGFIIYFPYKAVTIAEDMEHLQLENAIFVAFEI